MGRFQRYFKWSFFGKTGKILENCSSVIHLNVCVCVLCNCVWKKNIFQVLNKLLNGKNVYKYSSGFGLRIEFFLQTSLFSIDGLLANENIWPHILWPQ